MPKYLWRISYTSAGVPGLIKDGGSKRRSVVKALVEKAGGTLEAFYYAFGDSDAYTIVDLPDPAAAVAVSFAVNAAGAARLHTTVLLTPEEIDAATARSVDYRPPGA
jgi:uncharacterized protein with GYD domain